MVQLALSQWKTSGDPELIRTALRVRRLAERAALGLPAQAPPDRVVAGTLVAAWVRDKVDEGDRLRRQAEDLLFASDRQDQARAAYDRAERAYLEAIESAEKVRRAMLARDRALSDLIPITEWLAAWPPPPTPEQVTLLETFVAPTIDLWRKIHVLSRALETPNFSAIEPVSGAQGVAGPGIDNASREVAQCTTS